MAIENLNNMEVHGRHIKVDSADGTANGTGAGPKGGRLQKNVDKAMEELGMIEVYDVIANMKEFIQKDYNGAKAVITQYPVLVPALLRATELLHSLNPSMNSGSHSMPAEMQPPAQQSWNQQQPKELAPMASVPPTQQQPSVNTSEIINQVLQLTPEQIAALPPSERHQVQTIIQQHLVQQSMNM
eukprot:CAMPEP_0184009196 /NCGR_PEP_ID=MMETSP0954-20121128/2445_1 /TAXON_ID=627963 /ORGANISM="Aplanochytrium sp, Strain PBS07" /LENGTH=184 /DNA_ID=CAMNT_0026288491 /DNA_START=249 /DNA_END=803 /DNA_ORIENTATION=-